MTYHLKELLRIGSCGGGKKRSAGGPPMSTKPDFVRQKYGPLRDKTLRNALPTESPKSSHASVDRALANCVPI